VKVLGDVGPRWRGLDGEGETGRRRKRAKTQDAKGDGESTDPHRLLLQTGWSLGWRGPASSFRLRSPAAATVGQRLRATMPWITKNNLVDTARN
jgi:ABC-type phosphonate transport system ATPase subunit